MQKPFIAGIPVPYDRFFGREEEVSRICESILGYGQSIAVIGEVRFGKTSLLNYLIANETRQVLYGEHSSTLLLSYLDIDMFGNELAQGKFWEYALEPLINRAGVKNDSELWQAYTICRENKFGNFVLERLIKRVKEAGLRLVVLIDEFDKLISLPVINRAEFFGGLRSLSSRSNGALMLIISSTCDLNTLQELADGEKPMGSPYFNTLVPVYLKPFSTDTTVRLLSQAKEYFGKEDFDFIRFIAGGHPFLIQSAASLLLRAYESGENNMLRRFEIVANEIMDSVNSTLTVVWRRWTPETRKVFTIIALNETPILLQEKSFDIRSLTDSLSEYHSEVMILQRSGYIISDSQITTGWRINGKVMLWFLIEQLRNSLKKRDDMGSWLQENQWEGLIRGRQKEQLLQAGRSVMTWIGDSVKGTTILLPEIIKKSIGL